MDEQILRHDKDGVARVTLNRPDKLNALSAAVFQELEAHADDLAQRTDEIGCVLLNGAGRCFSAGADLNSYTDEVPQPNYQARVIDKLCDLPQPVVVAVHGYCYTGGLELALCADIILASESALFADTHGKWPMLPQWGLSQRLMRRVGRTRATEMMLTGRTYNADEAMRIDLVNAVYPDDAFESSVAQYCADMLENSWHSLRGYKHLIHNTDGMRLDEGLAFEYYNGGGVGPDMEDRLAAFGKK